MPPDSCAQVTLEGTTLTTGDAFYTEQQFTDIARGISFRITDLYEAADGTVYAVIGDFSNLEGPPRELPATVVANAVHSKLVPTTLP